jgi:hypothetical protein
MYRDELFFHGKDNQENFDANKKRLGDSWYYAKNKISYKRNSLGHRTVELKELNLDNYIICTGCSITEGIALEEQYRYSSLLRKELNVDVYNMGVASSGNDTLVHNLLTWLSSIEKKPKFIVIQWTDIHRFMTMDYDDTIQLKGLWLNTEPHITRFITSGDEIHYFQSKSKYLRNLLKTIVNIPIIEIPWSTDFPKTDNQTDIILSKTNFVDYGRDFMHPGIKTHRRWADMIIEKQFNRSLIN